MANTFTSFASGLLSAQRAPTTSAGPLFYSTRDSFLPFDADDDILGASVESDGNRSDTGRRLSFGGRSGGSSTTGDASARSTGGGGGGGGMSMAVPAFMSRLVAAPPTFSRGWKAYESSVAQPPVFAESDSDDTTEDGYEDGDSPPGAFLSTPLQQSPSTKGGADAGRASMVEPLLPPRTLFVYDQPMLGATGIRTHGKYRDSGWIVAYGFSVLVVLVFGVGKWWNAPIKPPTSVPTGSVFAAVPVLLTLSLISLAAAISGAGYVLAVRHSIRHVIHAALVGGPLIFAVCGVVALAGSFSSTGFAQSASDAGGWRLGVRLFALVCFGVAWMLARVALRRRKQVARAVAIGELAAETILAHPPVILLCLALSALSIVIAIPFLVLLSSFLLSPTTHTFSVWPATTLIVYTWSLAILRGIQHVVVGGVVAAYYFERDDPAYPGAVEVTRAAFHRATHSSLGSIIFASLVTSLATSLTTLLRASQRSLRSKHVHPLLQPLTYLVPIFSIITSALAAFNSFALSHAGITGEQYVASGRAVVTMLEQNQTGRLADSLLVRFVLLVTSTAWGTLSGLLAFLIASNRLESGKFAPVVSVLCFAVPFWTVKFCSDVCGDAVDSLFICMNIDLARERPSEGDLQDKTAEAFGIQDQESLGV